MYVCMYVCVCEICNFDQILFFKPHLFLPLLSLWHQLRCWAPPNLKNHYRALCGHEVCCSTTTAIYGCV